MRKIHIVGLFAVLTLILAFIQSVQQVRVRASAAEATSGRVQGGRAVMGQRISVQAAGRGNPWINLKDGREVLTAYSGPVELTRALEQNQVRPLSLSSADYDEDGVPDLVSGYSGPSGGIITLLRGNVDSIYPNAPEAKQRRAEGRFTEAPFLSPALVFAVPDAADFVGSGDFDGDSHWDVVVAARGSDKLYLLAGDGKGTFGAPKELELLGTVSTMVTGEINRPDGLEDVVVGINGPHGSKALVFEGPEGALRAKAEIFNLPAEATSLVLGQLNGEYTDLAISAGNELIVVLGRDRKLSLDEKRQAEVPGATVSKRLFASQILSVAAGDFTGNHATDLAVQSSDGSVQLLSKPDVQAQKDQAMTVINEWQIETLAPSSPTRATQLIRARISSTSSDNVVVVDTKNNHLRILSKETKPLLDVGTQAVAVLPMRLNEDALSDLVILRSEQAAPSIVPSAPTNRLIVTNTNDKGVGSLRAAIVHANSGPGAATITFDIPGTGVPKITPERKLPGIGEAVTIDGTTQTAGQVELDGSQAGGDIDGLDIRGGNSVVRGMIINKFGPTRCQDCIITIPVEGATAGIVLRSNGGNVIEGNFVGTDVNGAQATDIQGLGVVISGSSDNLIGGTTPQARNIISGNTVAGLTITSLGLNKLETTRNKVQGNFINTDVTGTYIVKWSFDDIVGGFRSDFGIRITNGPFGNLVGGTMPGAGNLISGAAFDNILIFDATDNLVQGNVIGTITEESPSAGADRAQEDSLNSNITSPSVPNVIVARTGVIIADPGGPAANNTIGGTTTAAGNLISNHSAGIEIVNTQSTGNLVQGNYISGNGVGVRIADSPDTTIGGASSGAGNIISNNNDGVTIGFGQIATPNETLGTEPTIETFVGQIGATVQGNYIETNSGSGVFVETESLINTIKENRIAFNGGNGVSIPNFTTNGATPGVRIAITSNLVFSNTLLGIDLGGDNLVTANDSLDTDAGANFLQNFPVLNSSGASAINGTLNSTPNSTFDIEFFFASGCLGGSHQLVSSTPVLLGSMTVTTNGSGNATFSFSFAIPPGPPSGFVNATATDQNGNTSEFSECIAVGS